MKTKADYKLAFRVVGAIIREWDPYSLFAVGCPDDEFDAEINRVLAQIPRIKSKQDATLALSRIFSGAFEPDEFAPEKCASTGAKLFAALQAHGLIT